jgi:putative CocE/NonD family hydrolase
MVNFQAVQAGAEAAGRRSRQALLVGPWMHEPSGGQRFGEVDFGGDATIDVDAYELAWLGRQLRDGGEGDDPPPVRIFVMGPNEWRDELEWPLGRTVWTPYYLRSGGSANSRYGDGELATSPADGDESPDTYVHDPTRPVPFISDSLSVQIGGPDDYSAIEQRADVLVYTAAELDHDVEVTGPVRLVLYASSSAVDTDFMGKLVDVHPSGFCQRLCDGMVRARYREGMRTETFLEPERVYELEVDLWNTSHVFRTGHRIRLEVASSAFPKYDRNLSTGHPLATDTEPRQATNRVWHTADYPSRLIVPVIPSSKRGEA